mmetsp:Transcript_6269/g.13440  ORF Transcript_6269/g.13440 Transcript_6269/m.13440 type:complete len:528 (-) Transcript_6269:247-1830(-)|eukprot:CAMPEP_0168185058 /NCGR_PEP_ID=MMETSP0139_2-20121125/13611_1 /TAXON_ID=44445 /ORGANISM="Pseudo-nitzschia australis, Strain 10249 10 AB" /LENGTH=527 /DNA_ID=CAMNT_0008106803 /DNA_START=310 /DNA_END=1893 /DNA_ORIENTATION=+
MKVVSFSVLLSLIAVSGAEAFAPNERSFVAPATQTQQKQLLQNHSFLVRGGALRKQQPKKNFRYTSVSASVGSTSASDDNNGNLLQDLASAPLTKAVLSSTLFVFTDMLIKNLFKAKGISFPSSLAGCCFMAATLLAAPFHEKLYRILNPGAKLMQKFMMIFLVPNLVVLPLCGGNYSALEMAKITTIIIGGFLFSLLSTCYSVTAVSKIFGTKTSDGASTAATTTETAAVTSHAKTAAPKAFSDELTYGSRTIMVLSGIAAAFSNNAGSTLTSPLIALSMLSATVHNFAFGARQPKKFTKAIHPLVSCTTLSWVWASLLGSVTGGTLTSMLQSYRVGGALSLASSGAGDFLTFVLGPAVVSLGVSIYERRVLIRQNLKEVLTATFVSCVGGLFGTAAVVRILGLASAELRLSMLPRNITSALAVAIAEIVGANKSLAVAIAIVTGLIGANFGASLLDLFGIKDPVTRGLGIGSAAHGLGTAAFVDEKDAFPFAAISMALTAICGTLLVSVPSVKALAIRIALGGLA